MDNVWHYGKKLENGNCLVKISRRKKPVETIIPESPDEIVDIYTALSGILLRSNNLIRVSGYFCSSHKKFHRFTFHQSITFSYPFMKGCDTEKEVIEFAKTLFKEK
ncbi:MAG: hypothetical protein BV456_01805 [Thermoplasmata archaeon M8B2D]|nr:MAG: hypothetical protein BV456_01805 [Thermoplasmata archaeon M8B2D]